VTSSHHRLQTLGEEIANAVSHGGGAVAALIALPVLIAHALTAGKSGVEIFAVSVFGISQIILYLASTLYHSLTHGPAKRLFRVLDHCAIYILIAGTYTPFALGVFKDSWGWTMFAVVWGLATSGILLKSLGRATHPVLSGGIYLAMGWLVLLAAEPLMEVLPRAGLYWLIAGGAAYSLGVTFFALDSRVSYAHFAWHLFVLAGSVCHFVAVLGYA